MSKVPFTNDKDHPVYSPDGKLVPAGETRMIDAPPAAAPEATPEPDPLLGLLDNSIKDIVPHLAHLDGPALERLLAAEQAGNTRKTLIEVLELRIMEEADKDRENDAARLREFAQGIADGDLDAALAQVPELAFEALEALGEIEAAKGDDARDALLQAIDLRITELAEAAGDGA